MVIINKKSVYFHHVAVDMAILAGYDVERFRTCPTEESITTNTGLFISPSGTSELDCATTKKDRAERSISIGRESLKVFFFSRGLGVLAGSTARG